MSSSCEFNGSVRWAMPVSEFIRHRSRLAGSSRVVSPIRPVSGLTIWLCLRWCGAFGRSSLGPGDMAGAWAMASLAGDVYIGPAGGIACWRKGHSSSPDWWNGSSHTDSSRSGLARSNGGCPRLAGSGPGKGETSAGRLVPSDGCPRRSRALDSGRPERRSDIAVAEDTEGVGDFIVLRRAVRTLGPHHELVAVARKSRCNTVVDQRGVGEIAEDMAGVASCIAMA